MEKFSRKNWFLLLLFGTIGQIAWSVENMFFGTFVYETFSGFDLADGSLGTVTLMVQLSGIVATLATLVAGTLSDKVGNRRGFISIGYIIWGVTVALFGCLTPDIIGAVLGQPATKVVTLSLVLFVVGDCVMTLFGSTANDAAFNAWVTDNTKPSYRGYVESVLSILPLIGLLIVAGGIGILTGAFGYTPVFIGLGILITLCGVIGVFLFKDSPAIEKSGGLRDIVYGFRPSVVKKHLPFYATLLSVAIFGISIQTFMSYIIIFMKYCLGFSDLEYSAVFAVAILAGAGVNLYLGKLSDRMSKSKLLYAASLILSVGLLGMYFASMIPEENKILLMILFGIGGFVMICGNIFSTALNGSIMRDHTPPEAAGKMQGVRMFASVLIPMIVGPAIGNALNEAFGSDVEISGSDVLTTSSAPAREIFLAGAIIALVALAVIPLIRKAEKKVEEKQ
ncbi:MAG: MFS transporter [Clostridia bacterium]|nr:MFS transporter [Clostridia bacterium]